MKWTARTAALVIVPLLAISSNLAQGAILPVVLPIGGFTCTPGGVGASYDPQGCDTAGDAQLATGSNNIQGLKFFGHIYYGIPGTSTLTFQASGPLNGTILAGTVIPLAYDFSLAVNGEITRTTQSWNLQYILTDNTISPGFVLGTATYSGNLATPILGVGSVTGTFTSPSGAALSTTQTASSGDLFGVSAQLTLNWGVNGTIDVTVPVNSFDVNSNAVPEPASLCLFLSGLALLACRLGRSQPS